MAEFTTPQGVRDYLVTQNSSGQWGDALLGSNIAVASAMLQRMTRRQFEPQGSNSAVLTKTFTSAGRSYLVIPDLREVVGDVTLNGSILTSNESYFLHPDHRQSGVYVGIEFPNARMGSHRDWFDRNYDHPLWGARYSTLPNNLSIPGRWGHVPLPTELIGATNVYAGWLTLRTDALLGGMSQTPEGTITDLSVLPTEVRRFVDEWKIDPSPVATVAY